MIPVFPTAFFGSIAYYQQLFRHETVAFEQWETFPKQTFRNRCNVYTANGVQRLTLPVIKPNGSKSKTNEIGIANPVQWQQPIWRTLFSAYGSSPYFDHYAGDIEALLFSEERNLLQFNMDITNAIARFFGVEIQFKLTNDYHLTLPHPELDFRHVDFDNSKSEHTVFQPYTQVYFGQTEFVENLSILDLLFCEGPMGRKKIIF